MILKGKKIALRSITLADAPRFVVWLNDPEVNKFLRTRDVSLREERAWIRSLAKKKDQRHFAIDTKDGVHIGGIGLQEIDKKSSHATFGIFIGDKRYWNEGYGSDALWVLLSFAFEKLKLHRVECIVYEYNPRAKRVYEKLGFVHEGTKREHVFYEGKFCDSFMMGIVKSEWEARYPK